MTIQSERPLVTLVLVAYKQAPYIGDALKSAFSQTYEPLEIIVSDDCSPDETYELLRLAAQAYRGPHRVRLNKTVRNVGIAEHLNQVIGMAEGEFIVVAAGDDICFPDKVSKLVQPMLDDPTVSGVHSSTLEIDLNGQVLKQRILAYAGMLNDLYSIVEKSLSVVSQSHAFRASVHKHFGSFNDNVTNEGKVMAFRECAMGKIVYVPEPLTYYRVGSGVSTYAGTDMDRLTIKEPQKIAAWHYTAILQIEKDSKSMQNCNDQLASLISNRQRLLSNLYRTNHRRFYFLGLLASLIHGRSFLLVLAAFIRYNSPRWMRVYYYRRVFRNSD